MKAVRAHRHGAPDVLVVEDVPTPRPGAGEILVRVESAAVNYADLVRRRNDPYPFPTTLPYTPGSEVAGTVEELGAGVEGPPPGTSVFALVGADGSTGYAQYAVAAAPQVVPIPPGLTPDEAAAVVVAGTTALLTLTEVGRLAAGETVLIEGAGGGVGGFAVQIAKLLGATVVAAAATPARRAAARALGADHVVDYTAPGWTDAVREATGGRGADVVLEIAGGTTFTDALSVLAPFGRVVVAGMAGRTPLRLDDDTVRSLFYDPALNQSLRTFNLGAYFGLAPGTAVGALRTLVEHVAAGRVTVPVGLVLPLSRAAEAHRLVEERRTTGKVVLKPWLAA
ncbi:MAG TPA: zinc-binding dehydrogenase [Pseudonocardia sp.]|nr:zinc-binding dehydrogenase [Pseudonocardia sp.]